MTGIIIVPASSGTNARTPGIKRARKMLLRPYFSKNLSLLRIDEGWRENGQTERIWRWKRWPSQKANPSPAIAPSTAAPISGQITRTPLGTKALSVMIAAVPGIKAPMTGSDSDMARKKTAV
ncbi:hypothetical protein OEG86_00655 [Hoeflea alexandrii]|nr:hypothetical protein [Hoeflea alexandrii]MCY0151029.1 hypothetical protein [Hoeflea alexandrii]